MGAMGLDSTLNIAHQACAKYSTLNKITHVNCAKTGDMEIAHVNVLEITHHFPCVVVRVYWRNYLDSLIFVLLPSSLLTGEGVLSSLWLMCVCKK